MLITSPASFIWYVLLLFRPQAICELNQFMIMSRFDYKVTQLNSEGGCRNQPKWVSHAGRGREVEVAKNAVRIKQISNISTRIYCLHIVSSHWRGQRAGGRKWMRLRMWMKLKMTKCQKTKNKKTYTLQIYIEIKLFTWNVIHFENEPSELNRSSSHANTIYLQPTKNTFSASKALQNGIQRCCVFVCMYIYM